jgi:hypothetical protein
VNAFIHYTAAVIDAASLVHSGESQKNVISEVFTDASICSKPRTMARSSPFDTVGRTARAENAPQ